MQPVRMAWQQPAVDSIIIPYRKKILFFGLVGISGFDFARVFDRPRWAKDFQRFLPLKSQFVLSGNVRDRYPRPGPSGDTLILPLLSYLGAELVEAGIRRVIGFDPARGFCLPAIVGHDTKADQAYFSKLGIVFDASNRAPVSIEKFFEDRRDARDFRAGAYSPYRGFRSAPYRTPRAPDRP